MSNLPRGVLRDGLSACLHVLAVWVCACLMPAVIASAAGVRLSQLSQGNPTSVPIAVQAVSSSAHHVTLTVSLPAKGDAKSLFQQGPSSLPLMTGTGQLEVGKPDVAVFGQWVLVPNGTTLSIRTYPGEPVVFDDVDVLPAQPPRTDSPGAVNPRFAVDVTTYTSDADYPGMLAYAEPVKTVRGQACTVVWLCPYQYNPITRQLSVYQNLVVVHKQADGSVQRRRAASYAVPSVETQGSQSL